MSSLLRSTRLRGYWDYPPQAGIGVGTYVSRDRRLALAGWAIADAAPTITIFVDGSEAAAITPTCYREDIDIIFSHAYPSSGAATGWATAIDVSGLDEGAHRFRVDATADGETISLGTRLLTVTPPREDGEASVARLTPLLRTPPLRRRGHQLLYSESDIDWTRHATSVFGYSPHARQIMAAGGTTLVLGAGLTATVDGVVQLDIFDYPNIDVVSFAPELPFKDEVFDGIVCENVIEHVPDPFRFVDEIARVLKPGGRLGMNGTNLHFTHGYPSHFFNPTEFGMRYLLEDRNAFSGDYHFADVKSSLWTVLNYYLNALAPEAREEIERRPLGEILAALKPGSSDDRTGALLTRLSAKAQRALSTNIYFVGTKQGPAPRA